MLNTIGTALSGFQQYHIQQKSKGIGLLVFFLIILLLAKWNDWFQPLADNLGITTFAHEIGLIQSTSVMTFLVAFILFVILLAFFSVLLYLGAILQTMFITAPMPVRIMLLLPFLIIGVALVVLERIFRRFVTKKEMNCSEVEQSNDITPYLTEQELALYKKHEAKGVIYQYGATYLDQFTSRLLSNEEAARFLNKAFAHANSTSNILVGFSHSLQRWFIIGAQPLPRYASSSVNFSMTELNFLVKRSINHSMLRISCMCLHKVSISNGIQKVILLLH